MVDSNKILINVTANTDRTSLKNSLEVELFQIYWDNMYKIMFVPDRVLGIYRSMTSSSRTTHVIYEDAHKFTFNIHFLMIQLYLSGALA